MFKKLKATTVNSFIGKSFFYADNQTGIGWTSKIDSISSNPLSDSYTLELSCGTLVKMNRLDLYKCKELSELTNLEK